MTTTNQNSDMLEFNDGMEKKLPSSLNVLTILSIIGSIFIMLYLIAMPMIIPFSLKAMNQAASSGQEFTAKQVEDMQKAKDGLALIQANMTPVLITGIAGCILCLVGVIMMRKYKKDGFWIYVAGQIMPLIAGFIIMGTAQYTSIWSYIFGIGVPLLFIVLYAMQRKYLVK